MQSTKIPHVQMFFKQGTHYSFYSFRKIEIIQFATNTRQQFIRLLALVKWAASAEKVDQCQVYLTANVLSLRIFPNPEAFFNIYSIEIYFGEILVTKNAVKNFDITVHTLSHNKGSLKFV